MDKIQLLTTKDLIIFDKIHGQKSIIDHETDFTIRKDLEDDDDCLVLTTSCDDEFFGENDNKDRCFNDESNVMDENNNTDEKTFLAPLPVSFDRNDDSLIFNKPWIMTCEFGSCRKRLLTKIHARRHLKWHFSKISTRNKCKRKPMFERILCQHIDKGPQIFHYVRELPEH
ncbi:hypothetical protein KQX54_007492 [Cotesia glomerata]|uniref:C2H2-type domain-containing protein n=1 Tax=Cotesia glomerata TaxID=32391 RepID=A0AAV7HC60_COTGL|nr:hypothetical protein KQX54_007492 [Cotesia glomerata]